MGIIEGTRTPKTVTAEYDFAKDGGTAGTKTLRGVNGWDNSVPAGSLVTGGVVEVLTAVAGATSVKVQLEGTADLYAPADLTSPAWTVGRKDVIPDSTGDTSIRSTVTRNVKAVIVGTATAGKFRVTLFYV